MNLMFDCYLFVFSAYSHFITIVIIDLILMVLSGCNSGGLRIFSSFVAAPACRFQHDARGAPV